MKSIFAFSCMCLCWLSLSAQNRGLNFAARDNYVQIDNPAQTANFITVEAWFNPAASAQDRQDMIFQTQAHWTLSNVGGTWAAGTQLQVRLYNDAFLDIIVAYTLPSSLVGAWHHVAFTYDGTAVKLYLDGILVSQAPFSGGLNANPGNQMNFGSSSYYYVGTMDEVRIWNVARTQAEIQNTMNREISPATPGLIGYYQFNQGTIEGDNTAITTLTDAATPAHDGTLFNFTRTGSTSNFVAGYPALIALELRLISFAAEKEAAAVRLQWKATVDKNIGFFAIERSSTGHNYSTIGTVRVQQSSSEETSYAFRDERPAEEKNYYRLKAVDHLGRAEYSNVLQVRMKTMTRSEVYPNPATDVVQLQIARKGRFTVFILDGTQRVVRKFALSVVRSSAVTSVDVSNLPKGIYFIHIGEEIIKFSKQ